MRLAPSNPTLTIPVHQDRLFKKGGAHIQFLMSFTYEIGIRLPLGKLSPQVKELDDSINATLATFGMNEKIRVTSVIPLTLTVGRQPSKKELNDMKQLILSEFKNQFEFASIEYVRRKSGNVQQSAV